MSDENKRRFVRMELENIPTTITRQDGSTFDALCKNLSGLGMLIETNESLELNEEISAHIKTERNELQVTASVTREVTNDDANSYGLTIITFN
ncbi:MAG: PilZ domain-containing protein [Pseudomonadota bacterium]